MPPKIIAPRRPLPMGSASVHTSAGWRYHRVSPDAFEYGAPSALRNTPEATAPSARPPFRVCRRVITRIPLFGARTVHEVSAMDHGQRRCPPLPRLPYTSNTVPMPYVTTADHTQLYYKDW